VSLEHAHTEALDAGANAHERISGTLGAGMAPRRWFGLSAELSARYDIHHGGDQHESGLAFATRLATRHAFDLGERAALALAPALTVPAADSVAHGFKALSPELSLLGSYQVWRTAALSLQGGYRLDRTRYAVENPFALHADDRLAAQLQRYDSALVGALLSGGSARLSWALEWSWDVGVGSQAPRAIESPMRVEAEAQTRLYDRVLLGAHVGASPSSRPSFDRLVRIEPRFWLGVSCGVLFGRKSEPRTAPSSEAPSPEPVVVLNQRAVLTVLEPSGAPIANAQLEVEGQPSVAVDAQGQASVEAPDGTTVHVRVSAEGFEPRELDVQVTLGAERSVTLERTLPAGEIKGSVRSLRGGPLLATITVMELEKSVQSGSDGSFRVDVPPGSYTLRISAPGHESQQRTVRVEQLGVAILVVDLRRSSH
jgi:hypothetical protein